MKCLRKITILYKIITLPERDGKGYPVGQEEPHCLPCTLATRI